MLWFLILIHLRFGGILLLFRKSNSSNAIYRGQYEICVSFPDIFSPFCIEFWFGLRDLRQFTWTTYHSQTMDWRFARKKDINFNMIALIWQLKSLFIRFLWNLVDGWVEVHDIISVVAGLWKYRARFVKLVPFPYGQVRNFNLQARGKDFIALAKKSIRVMRCIYFPIFRLGASYEYPKHMFSLRIRKTFQEITS